MSAPERRSDNRDATRAELLAEKQQLEAAERQNNRDLNQLRSRADGMGGKKHDQELLQKQGAKAEIDRRLAENQRRLDQTPEDGPEQPSGADGQSRGVGGYQESELRYERGSPHADHEQYKRIMEAERQAGTAEGARTADNPLDGVNSTLQARNSNRYPATDPRMDEHLRRLPACGFGLHAGAGAGRTRGRGTGGQGAAGQDARTGRDRWAAGLVIRTGAGGSRGPEAGRSRRARAGALNPRAIAGCSRRHRTDGRRTRRQPCRDDQVHRARVCQRAR